jgi:hypothetical protein
VVHTGRATSALGIAGSDRALALARRRLQPGRLGAIFHALAASDPPWARVVRDQRHQQPAPLINAHIALSAAGAACLLMWLGSSTRIAVGMTLVGVAALIVAGGAASRWRAEHHVVNPTEVPFEWRTKAPARQALLSFVGQHEHQRHHPRELLRGLGRLCAVPQGIYDQWNSSAHHFSSFNNQWYRKSIEYMQDVVGTQPSKWCAGCHDHAVFFNGRFDRPIKEQINTPEAQAGLACTSCHSITRVHSTMGQGDFEIEYPPLHDLAASEHPVLQRVHDALLYMAPEPHRKTFMKPFHREQTAEFCSSCHKVHLDVPVNDYRWIRGFNDYDNWQASGVSGQGARSFYYPAAPQRCADCHMPLVDSSDPAARNGKVRSHRFPGANTAVPYVNKDPVQLKVVQDFLATADLGRRVRHRPRRSAGTDQRAR